MAQLSRPFQIALAAMALFAIVWLLALRGHSGGTSGSGSSSPAPSQTSGSSSVYHGSAPGVEGLTRDLAKAHGAVTTSEQNAKKLAEQSARASGGTASATPTSTSPAAKASAPAASAPAAASKASAGHRASKTTTSHAPAAKPLHSGATAPTAAAKTPPMQAKVEAELKQGKVVTILFWNPRATDDAAVRRQLRSVAGKLDGAIAVHDALAGQVGSFGSIIRGVQVFGTPTILLINKHGLAQTLTGYTDAYSIEQAITEVRHA
jgi:hypothetical protein